MYHIYVHEEESELMALFASLKAEKASSSIDALVVYMFLIK